MTENKADTQKKNKGFIARWLEKLDKKMQEKAKNAPCCCKSNGETKTKCC